MAADRNALRVAHFKKEDLKEQTETTLEVRATALLKSVHHATFAQKDSTDSKPKKMDAISKVINTLKKVAENSWRRQPRTTATRQCRPLALTSRTGRSGGESGGPAPSPVHH